MHEDPRVREFLSGYVSDKERLRELTTQLEDAEREIDLLKGRVGYLQQELGRTVYRRDQYQEGYAELKAQLAVIMSTATTALQAQKEATSANLQSVINVIGAAHSEARRKMDDVERAPPDQDTSGPNIADPLEDGIRRIAKQFAPRPPVEEQEVE